MSPSDQGNFGRSTIAPRPDQDKDDDDDDDDDYDDDDDDDYGGDDDDYLGDNSEELSLLERQVVRVAPIKVVLSHHLLHPFWGRPKHYKFEQFSYQ